MSRVDADKLCGVGRECGLINEPSVTGRAVQDFASSHIDQLTRGSPALVTSQVLAVATGSQHDVMETTHGGHVAGDTSGQVPDLERAVQGWRHHLPGVIWSNWRPADAMYVTSESHHAWPSSHVPDFYRPTAQQWLLTVYHQNVIFITLKRYDLYARFHCSLLTILQILLLTCVDMFSVQSCVFQLLLIEYEWIK